MRQVLQAGKVVRLAIFAAAACAAVCAVAQISASADARRILAASADGDVTVVEDGRVRVTAALGRWITAAAISGDGTRGAIAKIPAASIHVCAPNGQW